MQAIKSPSLDYSHFVSLPLAIHPELVEKLINFQNSILGSSESCLDEAEDSDTNEDNTDNEVEVQDTVKEPDVAVELKVDDKQEHVKVNINIPVVSYPPKASKTNTPSGMITTEHSKGPKTCISHRSIGTAQFFNMTVKVYFHLCSFFLHRIYYSVKRSWLADVNSPLVFNTWSTVCFVLVSFFFFFNSFRKVLISFFF